MVEHHLHEHSELSQQEGNVKKQNYKNLSKNHRDKEMENGTYRHMGWEELQNINDLQVRTQSREETFKVEKKNTIPSKP